MNQVLGNRYLKYQKYKAKALKKQLVTIQNCIEQWIKFQMDWMRLESIILGANPEMKKALSGDISKFMKVDAQFQKLMGYVGLINQSVKDNCTEKKLNEITAWNQKIEEVDKGLQAYLDKKRSQCARFFFLDDEDLIYILSNVIPLFSPS